MAIQQASRLTPLLVVSDQDVSIPHFQRLRREDAGQVPVPIRPDPLGVSLVVDVDLQDGFFPLKNEEAVLGPAGQGKEQQKADEDTSHGFLLEIRSQVG